MMDDDDAEKTWMRIRQQQQQRPAIFLYNVSLAVGVMEEVGGCSMNICREPRAERRQSAL